MDLVVGDRVQVMKNINASFMLPEMERIYYVLSPNDNYTVLGLDDIKMIIFLGEGTNPMGAEVRYADTINLILSDIGLPL